MYNKGIICILLSYMYLVKKSIVCVFLLNTKLFTNDFNITKYIYIQVSPYTCKNIINIHNVRPMVSGRLCNRTLGGTHLRRSENKS